MMTTMSLSFVALFITISLPGIGARIVVAPNNATVCEGSTISLECSTDTDYKLRWFRVYDNGTKERVYSGRKLFNETLYSINTTGKGQFDLVIKSVSLELAGTYECVEQETHNQSAAEVIIIPRASTCGQEYSPSFPANKNTLRSPLIATTVITLVALTLVIVMVAVWIFVHGRYKKLVRFISETNSNHSSKSSKSPADVNSISVSECILCEHKQTGDKNSAKKTTLKIIGVDGTEYEVIRMRDVPASHPSLSRPHRSYTVDRSVYASIDHTMKPPPFKR